MTSPIDVFLCYRRAGAQTAKLFKRYLEQYAPHARVWFSDLEACGNYKNDIPGLIEEAECAVLFVDAHFVDGFSECASEMECITALEIVEMEKKLQRDSQFRIVTVYLDCGSYPPGSQKTLSELFDRHGVLTPDSTSHFLLSNGSLFNTARDDELAFFDMLSRQVFSDQYYAQQAVRGSFCFGSLPTSVDICTWDIAHGIDSASVCFNQCIAPPPALYRRIERIRCEQPSEIQNNIMISFLGMDETLTDNIETKQITIRYLPIQYRLFHRTLHLWNNPALNLNAVMSGYSSGSGGDFPIPNAMGLAMMVITSDGYLVFSRRSGDRNIRPNEYDCSIVEGLKPGVVGDDSQVYDIDDAEFLLLEARRAYREEICSDEAEILDIRFNAIVLDRAYAQWNVIGTIFTRASLSALINRHCVRDDTFEKTSIEGVSIRTEDGRLTLSHLEERLPHYLQSGLWDMALAVLYAALRTVGFSDSEIESMTRSAAMTRGAASQGSRQKA